MMTVPRDRIDGTARSWPPTMLLSLLLASVPAQSAAPQPGGAATAGPAAATGGAAVDAAPAAAGAPAAGAPQPTASLVATPRATSPAGRIVSAPVSARHVFRVYYGTLGARVPVAKLEYTVRHDGVTYEIRTRAYAEGLVSLIYSGVLTQVSSGRLGPAGLEPLQYVEQRGNRPQRMVSFDHEQRLLTVADRRSTVEFPEGTQDRLSVLYQLGLLARAAPEKFVAGTTHAVPVATMSRVSHETFSVVGPEVLNPAGRPIRALHLSRPSPAGTDDPGIDVWLGYDFDMLPVRVRFQDPGGRVLDQLIEQDS
jgi:hypothetical protein